MERKGEKSERGRMKGQTNAEMKERRRKRNNRWKVESAGVREEGKREG